MNIGKSIYFYINEIMVNYKNKYLKYSMNFIFI